MRARTAALTPHPRVAGAPVPPPAPLSRKWGDADPERPRDVAGDTGSGLSRPFLHRDVVSV